MNIKRTFYIFTFTILAALFGCSKEKTDLEAEHRQAAYELLEEIEFSTIVDEGIKTTVSLAIKDPVLAPFEADIHAFLESNVKWDELKFEVANLFMNEFSTEELRELTIYYRSDTTREKFDQKLPMLKMKAEQVMMKHYAELNQKMDNMLIEKINPNQRFEPTVKTPGDPVNEQGTDTAHP